MGCDYLESLQDFIITRCGEGAAYLVWKYSQKKTELELIDEIPIDEEQDPDLKEISFQMRGGILAQFSNGVKYDLVLLVTSVAQGFLINALKHKPLSEN